MLNITPLEDQFRWRLWSLRWESERYILSMSWVVLDYSMSFCSVSIISRWCCQENHHTNSRSPAGYYISQNRGQYNFFSLVNDLSDHSGRLRDWRSRINHDARVTSPSNDTQLVQRRSNSASDWQLKDDRTSIAICTHKAVTRNNSKTTKCTSFFFISVNAQVNYLELSYGPDLREPAQPEARSRIIREVGDVIIKYYRRGVPIGGTMDPNEGSFKLRWRMVRIGEVYSLTRW